ncbi:hypothetical protein [Methylobacterium sp. J-067]|uniref:hypothetical protein n=1 Tax=Methylobacterium sp. J-067 TaxID=2836648 RepID=UPI001FBACE75|nr:hypothetical protein [Methylobacterium sp. J-067]MCJ2023250.1 hypothetical protein [Methylobacterium sp. J-067]
MLTIRRLAILEPQVVDVPLRSEDQFPVGPSEVHSGPLMRADVTPVDRPSPGVYLSLTIYAHESDLPFMDLSFLRFKGGPCEVGPWSRKNREEGITGPILRPCFQLVPGLNSCDVELSKAMPRVVNRTVTTWNAA